MKESTLSTNNISIGLMCLVIGVMIITLFGCSSTSAWKQSAEEVPHYGLSEIKTDTGVCYVYTERSEGVSLSCLPKVSK